MVMTRKIPLRIMQEVRQPKRGNNTRFANEPKMADPPPNPSERKADGQARSVRKPFGHDGNHSPETESKANAAQYAVEKKERVKAGRVAQRGRNSG